MAKSVKPSQEKTPVIETATIIPEEQKEAAPPKIEEVIFEIPESIEKTPKEILTEFVQTPKVIGEIKPELNPKLSHKERIVAFLESRKGAGTIRLNDFLKSLYPVPKGNAPAEWTNQGVMKKLRHDLKELQAEMKISFVGNHYERLAKAHFPDQTTGRTHYWDLSNLIIEVDIS